MKRDLNFLAFFTHEKVVTLDVARIQAWIVWRREIAVPMQFAVEKNATIACIVQFTAVFQLNTIVF